MVDLIETGQKSSDIVIEADYYDTDAMVLQVTSSNMMPDARFDGTIVGREEQLDESVSAQTTDWFAICENKNYLTLSGGFNSSIWQFRDKAGLIIDTEAVDKQYNNLESHYTGNTIWSTVSIPKNAVEARVGSYNDTQPIINLSLNAVKQDISEKGNNWSELDLQTLSMLQKLFLVETACKDSQALFMGVVNLSWGTCYAVKDSNNEAVNTIELEDNTSSQKINVGDSVAVFDVPQGESYYTVLTQYQNNAGWNRVITGRTRLENGNVQLEFSGEPIHISKDSTMIMNLPHRTGKTNNMEYPTGQTNGSQSGTVAFRYRYIENLWGSLCVMLDGVTVNDGVINIEEEKGLTTLGYELAEQKGTTSEGVSPAEASIHTMGFDESNPLYMLPIEVGNGASSVTGYCDALFYQKNKRNLILTYGLTWDLRQYAGLFGYRANILADEAKVESGSRLVYR